jgi:hypothetical protein
LLVQELASQHADFSVVVSKLFQATITTKGFDEQKAEAFLVSLAMMLWLDRPPVVLSCFGPFDLALR